MIKIIKDGQKEFIGICNTCGCQFSYDVSDISFDSVSCPCCGHYYVHKGFKTNTQEWQKIQNEDSLNYCTELQKELQSKFQYNFKTFQNPIDSEKVL